MAQRLILALFLMNVGCAVKRQVAAAPPAPPYQGIVGSETSRLQTSNESSLRALRSMIVADLRCWGSPHATPGPRHSQISKYKTPSGFCKTSGHHPNLLKF